jgi:hypothetical protein
MAKQRHSFLDALASTFGGSDVDLHAVFKILHTILHRAKTKWWLPRYHTAFAREWSVGVILVALPCVSAGDSWRDRPRWKLNGILRNVNSSSSCLHSKIRECIAGDQRENLRLTPVLLFLVIGRLNGDFAMLHRNLMAPEIRKLVGERQDVIDVKYKLQALLLKAGEYAKYRFLKGKRFTATDLADIFENADELMTSTIQPCGRWTARKEATRIHPKGDQMEAAYVFVDAKDGHEFTLQGVRLFGTRKKFGFELVEFPFAFSYHAAERYLERYKGADLPLNSIAKSLMAYAFFLFFVAPMAAERNGGSMNIPAVDRSGIFLGQFEERDTFSFAWDVDGQGARIRPVESVLLECPVFVAKTFVGMSLLREDQVTAMEQLSGWNVNFADELFRERDRILWPNAKLLSTSTGGESIKERLDVLMTELIAILSDEGFQRGIKPHKDFVQMVGERDFLSRIQQDTVVPDIGT